MMHVFVQGAFMLTVHKHHGSFEAYYVKTGIFLTEIFKYWLSVSLIHNFTCSTMIPVTLCVIFYPCSSPNQARHLRAEISKSNFGGKTALDDLIGLTGHVTFSDIFQPNYEICSRKQHNLQITCLRFSFFLYHR